MDEEALGAHAFEPVDGWPSVSLQHIEFVVGPISRGNNSVWLQRWGRMQNVVKPYKAALVDYPDGTVIQVHPTLLLYERKLKVQEGLLQLGFVPGEFKGTFVRQPVKAEYLLQRKKAQRKKRKPNPSDTLSQQRLDAQALQLASNLSISCAADASLWDEEQFETATHTGSEWSFHQEAQVADLESRIVELTRQIRLLKALQGDITQPSPTPIILGSRAIVPTEGGEVTLELSYLDPDRAPFYINCDGTGQLLPCMVLGGRFISFKAPPHLKGSVPLTVMCEYPPGTINRYCRSIWLEYKTATELKAETSPDPKGPGPSNPIPPRRVGRPAVQSAADHLSPHPMPLLRRGHVKRRARDSALQSKDEGLSPRGSPAPPAAVPVQASPGNRCVSWCPAPDEEDISTEGSLSMCMLRSKSCEHDYDEYFNLLEDADVLTSTSKLTSYSSGSEAGKSESKSNDDADSLSRGQGSTISNPSICSRCTSVSRASSMQRARVMDSLRSMTLNYASSAVTTVPTFDFMAPNAKPVAGGARGLVCVLPSPAQAPVRASPAVAVSSPTAVDDSRIPLTRNVLEWHNEETGGLPHLKPPAHQWQAEGGQSMSSPNAPSSSVRGLVGINLSPVGFGIPTIPFSAFPGFGISIPSTSGCTAPNPIFAPRAAWPSLLSSYSPYSSPLPAGPVAGLTFTGGLTEVSPPTALCGPSDHAPKQQAAKPAAPQPSPLAFPSPDGLTLPSTVMTAHKGIFM
eukprot:GGOE01054948.1.p1 GENE.GGOE01054948.1~~GGOE01054948.1.p1  ORF type:complete len:741 (+),score=76.43 GGOE01054948.1:292-2514(+)